MKIVTVSREFGSGGRELGKRLADAMGFSYYDKEIITAIAKESGMDSNYVEKTLDKGFSKTFPFTFHRSFASHTINLGNATELLITQKRVIESIAEKGDDFVIVGRNADVILKTFNPFNIFVHADMMSKIERCIENSDNKSISKKEIEKNIHSIDAGRLRTRELLSGDTWGAKENYHLTINTTDWVIKDLIIPTKEFADSFFRRTI